MRCLVFSLIAFAFFSGCNKAGGAGRDNLSADSTTEACDAKQSHLRGTDCSEQQMGSALGVWVSQQTKVVAPMSYRQQLEIKNGHVLFSQLCSHQDGRMVVALTLVRSGLENGILKFLSPGFKSVFTDGISCQVKVSISTWRVSLTANSLVLDSLDGGDSLRFIRP